MSLYMSKTTEVTEVMIMLHSKKLILLYFIKSQLLVCVIVSRFQALISSPHFCFAQSGSKGIGQSHPGISLSKEVRW